jgi:hypothetical protein
METIHRAGQHGRSYWCIRTDLSRDGEIHVLADRLEITSCGALIAWGSEREPEVGVQPAPTMNLVCAAGQWSAAYAASPVDGSGIAIQSWAGGPPDVSARATGTEPGQHLREVTQQRRENQNEPTAAIPPARSAPA